LRRLKKDVEKQMPKKYEHVIKCKLSKRQRLLYDEFMSLGSTRDTLAEGRYMSVINILMQLRKVCNHPDLFDPRPTLSPFVAEPLEYRVPSAVFNIADEVLSERTRSLLFYQPSMPDMELVYSAFACHRSKRLQTPKKLIEELLTTNISMLEEDAATINAPSIDSDRFFINSALEGVDFFENPKFQAKIRHYLNKSQITIDLKNLKAQHYRSLIQYLIKINKQKCSFVKPVYGVDLQECIGPKHAMQTVTKIATESLDFGPQSYVSCLQALKYELNKHKPSVYWSQTETLSNLVSHVNKLLFEPKTNAEMLDILDRFVVYVPHVWYATKRCSDPYESETIKLRIPHPNQSYYTRQRTLIEDITDLTRKDSLSSNVLANQTEEFHHLNRIVASSQLTQFPEKRLIQYDCGKLQSLAVLLRNLYSDSHRVLIFTQMTKMLDILENFLNYHGYKYLRLDGSTGIDMRQALMERFNNDKRIFVFILSTRSGGIGVNLTGADTVVFYDSDWNPTMDAQAQDRCHRIGQTRDVNIYRLISERTVEENILRKANQKRLLSDMAIEGGSFTTALLTKHHITELFENDESASVTSALNATTRKEAESITVGSSLTNEASADESSQPPLALKARDAAEAQFEEALALVEDETDVKAAKELRAEVIADIAEFDENADVTAEDGVDENGVKRRFDEKIESQFKSIETEVSFCFFLARCQINLMIFEFCFNSFDR
jgi:E1A-binding protein p400